VTSKSSRKSSDLKVGNRGKKYSRVSICARKRPVELGGKGKVAKLVEMPAPLRVTSSEGSEPSAGDVMRSDSVVPGAKKRNKRKVDTVGNE